MSINTNIQLKQKILVFPTKFAQNGISGLKQDKLM